ncbi:hypothetical protein E4T56_gene10249 [Termitomyces sp. T112]|nr:hypothetical protein E4T56_gene10249 [Termitomyces sp. T112]
MIAVERAAPGASLMFRKQSFLVVCEFREFEGLAFALLRVAGVDHGLPTQSANSGKWNLFASTFRRRSGRMCDSKCALRDCCAAARISGIPRGDKTRLQHSVRDIGDDLRWFLSGVFLVPPAGDGPLLEKVVVHAALRALVFSFRDCDDQISVLKSLQGELVGGGVVGRAPGSGAVALR